jgi:signal transduction histidine kinase
MLLENLLSWSISQIKKEEPRIEDVAVADVVEENFQFLKIHADKKNQVLINSVKKGSILQTDRQILTIVLRNLIQNAIKFTPKGGRVEVAFDSTEWVATIRVVDNGLGMTAEKIKTLFSISKNRSSSGTDKEKGSGLGLILCKELVEKANGMIDVESTPNKGTTFKLKFNKVKI